MVKLSSTGKIIINLFAILTAILGGLSIIWTRNSGKNGLIGLTVFFFITCLILMYIRATAIGLNISPDSGEEFLVLIIFLLIYAAYLPFDILIQIYNLLNDRRIEPMGNFMRRIVGDAPIRDPSRYPVPPSSTRTSNVEISKQDSKGMPPAQYFFCDDCNRDWFSYSIFEKIQVENEVCPICEGRNIREISKEEFKIPDEVVDAYASKESSKPDGYFNQFELLNIQLTKIFTAFDDNPIEDDFFEKRLEKLGKESAGIDEIADPILPKELQDAFIGLYSRSMTVRTEAMDDLKEVLFKLYQEAGEFRNEAESSEEFEKKYSYLLIMLKEMENLILEKITKIRDYHRENKETVGEFVSVLSLLVRISMSHLDFEEYPKLLENTRKEDYNIVLQKIKKWLEKEQDTKILEFLDMAKKYINESI